MQDCRIVRYGWVGKWGRYCFGFSIPAFFVFLIRGWTATTTDTAFELSLHFCFVWVGSGADGWGARLAARQTDRKAGWRFYPVVGLRGEGEGRRG